MADIFRMIKNKNYTVMSNHHLQNPNLSLKAMGLMSKILSLPEDWNYSVKGLAAYCKDGYESVRTAFCELEAEGYLIRRTIRGEGGRIAGTEYIFRETPDMEIPEEEGKTVREQSKETEQSSVKRTGDRKDLPQSENPITVKKEEKSPQSENPITVKTEKKDSPQSDFPSSVNRDQQNTNRQNILYNIYTSSSSSYEENIDKGKEEEKPASKIEQRIKRQIDYEALCRKYGNAIPNEVVELLEEIYSPGKSAPFYTVSQKKVKTEELRKRLSGLNREQVQAVLEGMATGPPVRNIRRYLLTALYQADIAVRINELRKGRRGSGNKFNNFHQRKYDMEALEKEMLKW